MTKLYIKKPVHVPAIQLHATNIVEVYTFIHGKSPVLDCDMAMSKWEDYERLVAEQGLHFKTLESDGQTQKADIGDYILKGVQGEFYPCKPDIFIATYSEVKE